MIYFSFQFRVSNNYLLFKNQKLSKKYFVSEIIKTVYVYLGYTYPISTHGKTVL